MSIHNIHGISVNVEVKQGYLSEISRGRCIGKIVNLCREMPADEFIGAMNDLDNGQFGTVRSAAMLAMLDNALAANYTKRFDDEFTPIASLNKA